MFTACSLDGNAQQALCVHLNHQDLENASNQQGGSCFLLSAEFWGYIFQIVFQMTAGGSDVNRLCILACGRPISYPYRLSNESCQCLHLSQFSFRLTFYLLIIW